MLNLCKPVCKPVNQMSETIKVLCYKPKTLSNGEHPLMLCICKDRKRKYQSLGISIRKALFLTITESLPTIDLNLKAHIPDYLLHHTEFHGRGIALVIQQQEDNLAVMFLREDVESDDPRPA